MPDPSSQNSDTRILFSSTLFVPFIEEDEKILARHFPIERLVARGFKALLKIPLGVLRSDITLSWFGSVYAGYAVFLARLLGKKSVVVVAGVDASKDEEINYGIWLSPWKSVFVRYAFRNADRILTVDPFLQREAMRLAEYDGSNIISIPFGFDSAKWKPEGEKKAMVLTVAACEDEWRMKKKGIDKLIEAARVMSDVSFRVIGIHERLVPGLKAVIPPNMEIIPYVPRDELLSHYQQAKVYCQPSYTEGLPNTLCEAMLCGCIPVGTIAGGIPTAIDSAGYLVPYRDQQALVDALKKALASSGQEGKRARDRIQTGFTIEQREKALVNIITELTR